MHFAVFVSTLLVAAVSARDFTLYENAKYGGAAHQETRGDDDTCCMYIPCTHVPDIKPRIGKLTWPRELGRRWRQSKLGAR